MTEDQEAAPAPKGRDKAPNKVAEEIMEGCRLMTDTLGTTYKYNGAYWEEVTASALARMALEADGRFKTSQKRRNEIVSYIKAATCRHVQWGRVADWEVPCENGVVDVRTGRLRPHDPDDMLERVIPWPFTFGAHCPAWCEALGVWFPDEGGAEPVPEVEALQTFFGYVVLSHAKYKKALFLKGGSNTGKSVVIYAAQQLVGEGASCSLPLEHMDDPQRRAVIKGKLLNVVTEVSEGALVADGGFKQLVSTEEPVLIDAKYKPSEMYVSRAKHIIAANTLFRMNDRTEAILNRLLIVPMERVLSDDEQDEALPARLREQAPGLLLWAIAGARRLVEAGGKFPEVPRASEMLAELRGTANPARQWLAERCRWTGDAAVPLAVATDAFNAYNKGTRKVTVRGFGGMLRDAGVMIKTVRAPVGTNGERVPTRCMMGFDLIQASELRSRYAVDRERWMGSGPAEEVDADDAGPAPSAGPPPPAGGEGAPPPEG